MSTLPALGQGDEYDMGRHVDRVVTDPKIIGWRRDGFMLLGFDLDDAGALALRADVSLRDVEKWRGRGATVAQILAIVRSDNE